MAVSWHGPCLREPPAFRAVRAGGLYEGTLLESIHRLKFGRDLVQVPSLVNILDRALGGLDRGSEPTAGAVSPSPLHVVIENRPAYDLLIPVPLHPRRLRERGFNQAHLLSAGLMRRGVFAPWTRLAPRALARIRETPPQTRLPRRQRRANLHGAFRAIPVMVRGRSVLLVDDVMTTGTTLDVCARALMRAGARVVDGIVVARVIGPGRRG